MWVVEYEKINNIYNNGPGKRRILKKIWKRINNNIRYLKKNKHTMSDIWKRLEMKQKMS